jgi:hypothetical protein
MRFAALPARWDRWFRWNVIKGLPHPRPFPEARESAWRREYRSRPNMATAEEAELAVREKLPTLRHVNTFITIWRAGSEGENCAIPTRSVGQKRARDTMLEARAAAVGQQMRAELGEQFTTQVISQLVKLIQAAPRGTMPQLEPPEPPVEQVLLYPPETECCDESLLAEPAQQHVSQGEGADDKDAPFFVIHRFGKPPAEGREFKKVCQRCKTVYRYSEVITPPAKKQGATAPRRRRYRAGTRNRHVKGFRIHPHQGPHHLGACRFDQGRTGCGLHHNSQCRPSPPSR